MLAVEDILRYGIKIMRARSVLLPVELTKPAFIASRRHAQLVGAMGASYLADPASFWRFERLVPPDIPIRERWATWENQQADPLVRAEVELQQSFFDVSRFIYGRVASGNFLAYARRGDALGEWVQIPPSIFRETVFLFDPSFKAWCFGHAQAPGLDFWDIRLIDVFGLSLIDAAIAYGNPADAKLVQQHRIFRHKREPNGETAANAVKPDSLSARMSELQVFSRDEPTEAEIDAAFVRLKSELSAKLQTRELITISDSARVHDLEAISFIGRSDHGTLVVPGFRRADLKTTMPAGEQADAGAAMAGARSQLKAEGKFFQTKKIEHQAVLGRLGIDPNKLPRGYSYQSFAKL